MQRNSCWESSVDLNLFNTWEKQGHMLDSGHGQNVLPVLIADKFLDMP